jgi:hypothetical protein
MGTLNDQLADAVVCGSLSADSMFGVHWSSRNTEQPIHSNLINPVSSTASPAVGAEIFRDNATRATSL